MGRFAWLILLPALTLSPACRKKRAPDPAAETAAEAAPDAGSGEVWTPSGSVNPEKVGKQVEDTLQKEHEKTLDPKVE